MKTERIQYIDAMRGFTMILVVYSHICGFCLGNRGLGYNDVLFLFRLPCFFFISGWLFYQADRQWNSITIKSVVHRKFMVQIVPTFIFLLLLAPPPLFFSRLGATKGGYWFTFVLFEFFVLNILSNCISKRKSNWWGMAFAVLISVSAFCYDVFYNRYFRDLGWMTDLLGFLSFMAWRYYLFFFLGTLAKKYFDDFLRLTGKRMVRIIVITGFICIAMMSRPDSVLLCYLIFAVGGILGMVMVFTFFRVFASWFTKERPLGRALQYVGTRTLDIYLLHYFLLPRFLQPYGAWLQTYDNRALEVVVVLTLALAVVGLSLLASSLIRLNPFLGHWLFGVKYERQK